MDVDRAHRLALNEAVARDINAAVEGVAADWHERGDAIELICECSRVTCAERIQVTLADYYAVRENPHRFLLIDDHVNEEIERRVGTAGSATVVEKEGPGRQVADLTA